MSENLEIRILTTWSEVAPLAEAWERLWIENHASPVLSFDWMRLWWAHHGKFCSGEGGGLRVITFWDAQELVAILPLYEQCLAPILRRTLRFIGTGEQFSPAYPEYLDILSTRAARAQVFTQLYAQLFGRTPTLQHDVLDMGISAAHGALAQWAESLPVLSRGWLSTHHAKSYYADLSHGFSKFLETLPSEYRQRAKRLLRDAEALNTRCTLCTDRAVATFEELVDLHQSHWTALGHPGAFGTKNAQGFQIEVASALLRRNRAILARIHTGNKTDVLIYGLRRGETLEFYLSGRSLQSQLASPGITGHLLLQRELCSQGIKRYDYLAGEEPYKRQFASGYQHLVNLRFSRLNLNIIAVAVERALRHF